MDQTTNIREIGQIETKTSNDKVIKVIAVIAIILVVFAAIYLALNFAKIYVFDKEYKLGIITPASVNTISLRELQKDSVELNGRNKTIQTYFDPELKEIAQRIQSSTSRILETNPVFTTSNLVLLVIKPINFPTTNLASKNFFQLENLIVSGNYIYYLSQTNDKPEYSSLISALYPAILFAQNYINTKDSDFDAGTYDAWNSYFLGEYRSLSSGTDTDLPYPEIIAKYKAETEICPNLNNYAELFACEVRLFILSQQNLIPEAQHDFLAEEVGLAGQNISFIIGIEPVANTNSLLKTLGKTESKLQYKNWEVPLFKGDSDNLPAKVYEYSQAFNGLNDTDITTLQNKLGESGWVVQGASDIQADSQFAAEQQAFYFSRTSTLITEYLTILTLDTAGLNVECFVEGVGQVYCGENSIDKNSGLYTIVASGFAEN